MKPPTKKIVIASVALVALLSTTAASCDDENPTSQKQGQAQTEQAFSQQRAAVPYPAEQLRDSLERRNLREKLLRYNNPSKISYLYLLSQTGGIYAYFTVKGKVSSNQSQMTTQNLIERHGDAGGGNVVTEAPGDDGSYAGNETGNFAFTTDGVMVTWEGPYILTDAPLKINAQNLVLQYQEGSKPSSTAGR